MASVKDMLNLAKRGRFLSFGDDLLFDIRKKRISLVLLASDGNDKTKAILKMMCDEFQISIITCYTKAELGEMVNMFPLNAIGIKNSGISKKIRLIRKEIETNGQTKQEQ